MPPLTPFPIAPLGPFATPSGRGALPFILATGIECSAPRIAGGRIHDQLRASGHWTRFAEDAALVADLGIPYLRYGIPFHVVARDPGRLDWDWTDRALEAVREHGVVPIADLLHFGIPDDLAGIGDPRLVGRFTDFVEAFVHRYPWIDWYTPVNEPYITAYFSGRTGYWNERGTDDVSFVRALLGAVECTVRAAAIIREARPEAILLQSDACDRYAPEDPASPTAVAQAALLDGQVLAGFDLTLGHLPEPPVLAWLAAHGVDDARLGWFEDHAVSGPFIVGLDYYPGNERLVDADGIVTPDSQPVGFAATAARWVDRYGLPVMLAETNRVAELAVDWLDALWDDAMAMRAAGQPMIGFCWYSLTDQVDWDIQLRAWHGTVNSVGLADLDRRLHPVGRRYAELARLAAGGLLPRQILATLEGSGQVA